MSEFVGSNVNAERGEEEEEGGEDEDTHVTGGEM